MLGELKGEVFRVSLNLVKHGLAIFTWGNVPTINRVTGLVVIKLSRVSYGNIKTEDMTAADLDGSATGDSLKPSPDTPTHLALYKTLPEIGGMAHTHPMHAVAWAQAGYDTPNIGTIHVDYFRNATPHTTGMTEEKMKGAHELKTGDVITRHFEGLNPVRTPGVLVKSHGPFPRKKDVHDAVHNAVAMK